MINTGPKRYLKRKDAALLMLDIKNSRLELIIGY
jgi:hypothetical protein